MWIPFPEVPGRILSLSTQCLRNSKEVKVLVLCAGHENKNEDGSQLTVLSLPARNLTGTTLIVYVLPIYCRDR